jgi:sterol desaturase/sphingolipid hydroxylase (fatty acid hydroxylase superfamily)
MLFSRFCTLVPIYVMVLGGLTGGPDSMVPVLVTLLRTVWGFFIYANLCWRFGLERLISTPTFHHWHHTRTGPINRNCTSTSRWLDWIFGTHYLTRRQFPSAYGIDTRLPDSLAGQLACPLRTEREAPVLGAPEAARATWSIRVQVSQARSARNDHAAYPSVVRNSRALVAREMQPD